MLSAVIPSERSQPAMHLAVQLAHQRFVHPGPLVLGTALLKFPARTEDRDRTVSRRSEPSSRTALMGLFLFMFWIFANNHYTAFAFNDFTFFAYLFN